MNEWNFGSMSTDRLTLGYGSYDSILAFIMLMFAPLYADIFVICSYTPWSWILRFSRLASEDKTSPLPLPLLLKKFALTSNADLGLQDFMLFCPTLWSVVWPRRAAFMAFRTFSIINSAVISPKTFCFPTMKCFVACKQSHRPYLINAHSYDQKFTVLSFDRWHLFWWLMLKPGCCILGGIWQCPCKELRTRWSLHMMWPTQIWNFLSWPSMLPVCSAQLNSADITSRSFILLTPTTQNNLTSTALVSPSSVSLTLFFTGGHISPVFSC